MPDGPSELRLITFRVGTETFVLDIMAVRQIVPYAGSTPVPKAPSFIEGIIVLRNEVIPVIDLRARFFPQLEAADKPPMTLIVRSPAGVIGVKVDEVRRIITVPMGGLLEPPALVRGLQGELFIAVVPHGEDVYLLVDLDALLSAEEHQALQALETAS